MVRWAQCWRCRFCRRESERCEVGEPLLDTDQLLSQTPLPMTPPTAFGGICKNLEVLSTRITKYTTISRTMETTLPLPFLPSVALGQGSSDSAKGLTQTQLSYLGVVHFLATTETVDELLRFLQKNISIAAHVDVTAIESTGDITTILDAGARKIFVNVAQFESLKAYGDRVIPTYEKGVTTYTNGVLVDGGVDASACKAILEESKKSKTSSVFLTSKTTDLESFVKLAAEFSVVPIIPASHLTIGSPSQGEISVSTLIGESWTSDRTDKLVPTVVTDERGVSLGLVYSSQESLSESLKTGTGVYQSRKRGLWYKGATSGDTQELVRVSLDCDQDCLKFVVRQKGRGMWKLKCVPSLPS